ncbi:MAG: hypothetical protein JW850_19000 [Thermoflexales bacterium]|nr:hypothetical protein [Thermoflexales bacterium]
MNTPDWEGAERHALKLLEGLPPGLAYHGIHHTRDDALPSAHRLAEMSGVEGEGLILLRTAVLYHDTGYLEQYFRNEPIGARIAAETLPAFGFSPSQIQAIRGIIMATQLPQSPHTFLEELICDADLDSLGRDDYFVTAHNLRDELEGHGVPLTMQEWYERQIQFLTSHSYFTAAARSLRDAGKQKNIQELERRLRAMEHKDPKGFKNP